MLDAINSQQSTVNARNELLNWIPDGWRVVWGLIWFCVSKPPENIYVNTSSLVESDGGSTVSRLQRRAYRPQESSYWLLCASHVGILMLTCTWSLPRCSVLEKQGSENVGVDRSSPTSNAILCFPDTVSFEIFCKVIRAIGLRSGAFGLNVGCVNITHLVFPQDTPSVSFVFTSSIVKHGFQRTLKRFAKLLWPSCNRPQVSSEAVEISACLVDKPCRRSDFCCQARWILFRARSQTYDFCHVEWSSKALRPAWIAPRSQSRIQH